MAKYPVEQGDPNGLLESVNYLLSGPAGSGQNFQGFSDYNPVYIRPTFRQPFTLPVDTTLDAAWYLELTITNIVPVTPLPSNQFTVTFTPPVPYTNPPFQFGDKLQITGVVDTGGGETYNYTTGSYTVLSSTTTTVTLFTQGNYNWNTYVSGGVVYRNYTNNTISTDCNAKVTVLGPQDRVFVTAQTELTWDMINTLYPPTESAGATQNYDLVVQINRYVGSETAVGSGQFLFAYQATVAQKIFNNNGSFPLPTDAVFTTFIDGPNLDFGYYWYILEIAYVTKPNLGDGTYPPTAGYNSNYGFLVDNGFTLAPLPDGVTSGNFQDQSIPPGTTYTNVPGTVIKGIGANIDLDITMYPDITIPNYTVFNNNNSAAPYTVDIVANIGVSLNNQFRPGDVIKILGTDIGGVTPLNDMYLTVTETDMRSDLSPRYVTAGLRSLTAQVIKQ